MSSSEEDTPPVMVEQAKRKKKQRACDFCRRKKSDGAEMPDHRCSRCIGQGIECTYEPINTRPPSKSYVQILENRLQNMEKLFGQLHPNVQIPKDFDGVLEASHLQLATDHLPPDYTRHSSISNGSASAVSPPPPDSPLVDSDELEPSDDEQEARRNILENLKRIPIITHPSQARYHGKSSNLMFLQTVMDMKQKYTGIERPRSAEPALRELGMAPPRRAEFNPQTQWLKDSSAARPKPSPYRDFPPPDLMEQLVNAFFMHYNLFVPLLHRPTLEQGIKDGLHLRDRGFGAVLLLVCANGSRVVDDPRVMAEDGRHVAGWKWFEQVETVRWSYLERPRLEDLQSCALISMYLGGTNVPQGSWTVIGLGLRMAQDMGAHRKKVYNTKPTVEDELMKRAFWALIVLDRISSFGLGRPCAIHDEDFDVEPLLEVDDEYWINSDPEQAFKQPEGKPSYVTFANCLVRLLKILAFASRTIYSINKSKLTLGMVGPAWEQKIVAELDSAMNKWVDTVPPHLQWDPDRVDHVFLNQSATLYAKYYLLQICIHRPFIPSPRKPSRLTLPSLAICTNAARSCTHVLDIQMQRTGTPLLLNRMPLFTSGLVLLLNMWGGKRSGLSNQSTMADVHKCMNMLKQLERFTQSARRLWDVLNGLISIGEFAPPGSSAFPSGGQPDVGSLLSVVFARDAAQPGGLPSSLVPLPRSEQAQADEPMLSPLYNPGAPASWLCRSNTFTNPPSALPVHTEELGRLPFHHGFSSLLAAVNGNGTPQRQRTQPPDIFAGIQPAAGPSTLAPAGRLPDAAMDTEGFNVNAPGFPMRVTDYSELLSALSAPSPPQQQHSPQYVGGTPSPMSMNGDSDVAMLSAENMAFADNMMEMWSTAPASFEWDDWGSYLANMTGVDQNNPFHPPGPPPTTGF
ncbi:fungal-specific transcription factor domain-containing protein [Cerioporus squamosus]|nr:fungal-specific transcription factor domain-containing protein [Cerioporus squamosus]